MDILIPEALRLRVVCWVKTRGAHDWKRAVRTLGNSGRQACRLCRASQLVELRPRRQPIARTGADVAKG